LAQDILKEGWRRFPSAWARANYYIPTEGESRRIHLEPYQEAVLDYAFARVDGRLRYDTILWSQPKKSGKSTIAGMVGRWAAESWGQYGEVLYVGNDLAQAIGRGFAAHKQSIELTPGFIRPKGLLPDRWQVQAQLMTCLNNGTTCKAIATDYQGEAGANPIITIWEELWGFIHKDALRFWAEVAPSPARPDSVRMVVTYAGYEGESELLWSLYEQTVKEGRQLRVKDMRKAQGAFAESPDPDDLIPCYVNDSKRMMTFWDCGTNARRMPWLQGERGRTYYASEAGTQSPQQFQRLHLNEWVSSESEFVPIIWWDACKKPPLPMSPGEQTPMVLALDAAVTGDCFGLVIVSRDPDKPDDCVRVRHSKAWIPPKGGAIDFREVENVVREACANFNIVEICYDPYQLHDFATRLLAEGVGNFHEFNQGADRLEADTMLYQLICHKRVSHSGEMELREHIQNANAKLQKDEDSHMRICKKAESRKVDLCVALSMSAYECLRLNL
jgi:phage terminase large subunit-like protein